MPEKQTYTQGPERETHIEVSKVKKIALGTLATGALIGAGVATMFGGTGGEAASHESDPTKNPATSSEQDQPDFYSEQVQQGDTLWELASEAYPEQDPRDVVQVIQNENEATLDHGLQPGLILKIPTQYNGDSIHIPISNEAELSDKAEAAPTQEAAEPIKATPSVEASEAPQAPDYVTSRVGEGDSIEAIASMYYPDLDSDAVVNAIESANPSKDPAEFYKWGTVKVPATIGSAHAADIG